MPDNPLYKKGSIWRARRNVRAYPDTEAHKKSTYLGEAKIFTNIPRGEYVMLLNYYMGRNYEENVIVLWGDATYFVYGVDTAFDFNIDPKGYNTEKAMKDKAPAQS